MIINQKKIVAIAYLYMLIPICIFFLTWLKLWIGVIATGILIYGFYKMMKSNVYSAEEYLKITPKTIIFLVLLVIFWCWIAGQGGFFYQTWDNHYRNAIFRDLITHEWPVYYEAEGSALIYYFAQWIVPAVIGKFTSWEIANIALFVWDGIGIILTILMISTYLKANKHYQIMLIIFVMIIWGGLHLLPQYITYAIYRDVGAYISTGDGWFKWLPYQYSTNHTLLQWVYNQTIVPWLATALLLYKSDTSIFIFLAFCVIPFGPFPFIGMVMIMLCYGVLQIKDENIKSFLKKICSIYNISALITLFPIYWLFYSANSASSGNDGVGGYGFMVHPSTMDFDFLGKHIAFLLVEYGIYWLLIRKDVFKKKMLDIAAFTLIFMPIFKIGTSCDFCMRASIPALFIIMIYVMEYVLKFNLKDFSLKNIAIIVCLTISFFNAFGGLSNSLHEIKRLRQFPVVADQIGSLDNYKLGKISEETIKKYNLIYYNNNFMTFHPEEQLFFKCLAPER